MAGSALRRLMAEYKRKQFSFCFLSLENEIHPVYFEELTQNAPEGIVAGPISEDNFFEWEALIT